MRGFYLVSRLFVRKQSRLCLRDCVLNYDMFLSHIGQSPMN